MSLLSLWICYLGIHTEAEKNESDEPLSKEFGRRKTICQVDMDVKPPKAKIKTWGVASDSLTMDVITVTPKGSPQSTRKVRLPSSSPLLRSKSVENLDQSKSRTKLKTASSKESSVTEDPSGDARPAFKTSMGSLISVFRRFGRQTSNPEGGPTGASVQDIQKEPDLRRIVVDPLRSSRPDFKRSFSSDPQRSPAPSSSLHGSEQHLHFLTTPKKEPPPPRQETFPEMLERKINRFESSEDTSPPPVRKPLLPPAPPKQPITIKRDPDLSYLEKDRFR